MRFDGEVVNELTPAERGIAMVFQSYALYPHMSVYDNMAFGLKLAKIGKEGVDERVRNAARILQIEHLLERKPKQLSGGQRQRVAMGRALVREPAVFCMDEPLSNLDAKLRVSTRTQIAELQQRLGITTVYVTHDQVEAMTLGDRVAVLDEGRLQQVDTPLRLYDQPANLFVAGFIGSPAMNLLSGTLTDGKVDVGGYLIPVDRQAAANATGPVTVGIRPDAWRVTTDEAGLAVRVTVVEELGADAFVYGTVQLEGNDVPVTVRVDPRGTHDKGATISVVVSPAKVHLFDNATGERL
jgi:multiple sugar transport system ATP-binding protein